MPDRKPGKVRQLSKDLGIDLSTLGKGRAKLPRKPQSEEAAARQKAGLRPPWKKGCPSPNPSGRPRGTGLKKISDAYIARLEQPIPEKFRKALGLEDVEGEITWAEAISFRAVIQATRANGPTAPATISLNAIRELREVTEGPLPTKIEQTGKDGAPLAPPSFQVNFVDPKKKGTKDGTKR